MLGIPHQEVKAKKRSVIFTILEKVSKIDLDLVWPQEVTGGILATQPTRLSYGASTENIALEYEYFKLVLEYSTKYELVYRFT